MLLSYYNSLKMSVCSVETAMFRNLEANFFRSWNKNIEFQAQTTADSTSDEMNFCIKDKYTAYELFKNSFCVYEAMIREGNSILFTIV